MGVDGTSFGTWMDHCAFVLSTESAIGEEIVSCSVCTLAPGDFTDCTPAGIATWLGNMVRTPIAEDDKGNQVAGTATRKHDMAVGGLDAAFSGIRHIDRGQAHPVEALILSNIAVGVNGTFATGQSGTRI